VDYDRRCRSEIEVHAREDRPVDEEV